MQAAAALLEAARARADGAWTAFQSRVHALKLSRTALLRPDSATPLPTPSGEMPTKIEPRSKNDGRIRIVLITGFESFNQGLYRRAAAAAKRQFAGLELIVFSDRDILTKRAEIEAALDGADVFFGSLLFDFDQVEWLKERVAKVPLRLVFESALELMSETQV